MWPVVVAVAGATVVALSCTVLPILIVVSGPGSVTIKSADESSSAPALADSRGILFCCLFVAIAGESNMSKTWETTSMGS